MYQLRKHWGSLRMARAEQVGWENRWYAWYYPYSRVISLTKGFIMGMAIGMGILCTIRIISYFNL
jgi:hypothetical protein